MSRHSSNPKHNLVLDLYANEPLRTKEIAHRAKTSPDNVSAIVMRGRRRKDQRAFARKDPLAIVASAQTLRRLKELAEHHHTTPFGIASAILEMVAHDPKLFDAVTARVHRMGRK